LTHIALHETLYLLEPRREGRGLRQRLHGIVRDDTALARYTLLREAVIPGVAYQLQSRLGMHHESHRIGRNPAR
jgi:hypothetical protein